jgi:hypothetical protein
VPTAPAAADYDQRWRRVIFDAPDEVVIQRLDDSVAHYAAAIDPAGRTLLLSRGRGARWRSRLTFERPSADVLTLAGTMDGVRIEVRCRQTPLDTLRLLGSRFRWVRPPDPFAG